MGIAELLYLSQADVVAVGLAMSEIIDRIECAFRKKGEGRHEMRPKPGIHPGGGDNFIHAMPAYIPAMKAAGMEWVSGFPANPRHGLPYISGLVVLSDPATGLPTCVMDCVWITPMHTAGATAVAARQLARLDSKALGILSCGVQGRTHTEALHVVYGLERVIAYDTDKAAAAAFAEDIAGRHGLDVVVAENPRQAVADCDLIVTAGPILRTPHATIQAGWWSPGALKSCTDDVAQLRLYQQMGCFQSIPPIHADLGELVVGCKPGCEDAEERTIACNLGLVLDDMAVAPTVLKRAREKGIGTPLPL